MKTGIRLTRRLIGGFAVVDMRADELIDLLQLRLDESRPTELLFANTNFVVTCRGIAEQLNDRRTLIVNDGIGVDLASWLIHQRFFSDNLNGTDLTPRFLARLERPTRVFLLGSRAQSVRGAASTLSQLPNVIVAGLANGYEEMKDAEAVLARVREASADVLLVALGDPRQAQWIVAHRARHGVPLVIGVGALFDFLSGNVPRAPWILRRLRLEWLYRLAHEPRRLIKRYSIDLATFFAHCVRTHRADRLAGRVMPGRSS